MKNSIKILIGLALLAIGSQAQALSITPSTPDLCTPDPLCDQNNNATSYIDTYMTDTYGVAELYKQDQGTLTDSGTFASSYETTFANTTTDPSDATITYVGGTAITCGDCYLVVKDGNQEPAWYLFDISSWDGTEIIELTGFWPDQGAISHVSIYGAPSQVPEPQIAALLGLGLLGMVVARRKTKV